MSETYCNNCGKPGHIYNQCKVPITSFGVISFRYNPHNQIEFLMIRRKDTLGYIDFIRGKYLVQNKYYIMNMLKQMTRVEKELLREGNFDKLWKKIWGKNIISNKYRAEESQSKDKYNTLFSGVLNKNEYFTLNMLIDESNKDVIWEDPEWGFPKGRRNYQEKDYDCAIREFCEETGYNACQLKNVQNILPFEEIFTGSNYKSYKHKYYLMNMDYVDSLIPVKYEESEVSKMEWKTFNDCLDSIREYNLEKKRIITNIYNCLTKYKIAVL
jgi:ADP-ribose pyrophosphatase YjhB (NUDIX family)